MATDPQTLLDAAKCYACYSNDPYSLGLMELALLQQTVLALNPMADTSAATLLAQANCYACYGSNPYMLNLMKLALLAQLAGGGSGGGGLSTAQMVVYTGTDPTSDGLTPTNPNNPAIAYKKTGDGPEYYWNTSTHVWN